LGGYQVPRAFQVLEEVGFPHERILPNAAITTQNFEDVDDIVGFCLDQGYHLFIEEFVALGRGKRVKKLKLTEQQREYLWPLIRGDCIKPRIQTVSSYDGYLRECKGINTPKREENYLITPSGEVKDLFTLRSTLPHLAKTRHASCGIYRYCESCK